MSVVVLGAAVLRVLTVFLSIMGTDLESTPVSFVGLLATLSLREGPVSDGVAVLRTSCGVLPSFTPLPLADAGLPADDIRFFTTTATTAAIKTTSATAAIGRA